MSTKKDFKNAPVGSTATGPNGRRAFKTSSFISSWVLHNGLWESGNRLLELGYSLDQSPAPKTAREALDLAWELAHPIKEGQFIPAGVRYVRRSQDGGLVTLAASGDWTPEPRHRDGVRTLDPLPEPTLDWMEAPAVLATHQDSYGYLNKSVWHPIRFNNRLWSSGALTVHWYELMDVTPLYPKVTTK